MTLTRTLTEAEWLTRVVDTARIHGWHAHHARPARTARGYRTALQGDRGAPDLLLARDGVVLLAELKTDTGRLGPGQRDWLDACGDHARLWRPRDWDAVLATLNRQEQS